MLDLLVVAEAPAGGIEASTLSAEDHAHQPLLLQAEAGGDEHRAILLHPDICHCI